MDKLIYTFGFPCYIKDISDWRSTHPLPKLKEDLSAPERKIELRQTIKNELAKKQIVPVEWLFYVIDRYALYSELSKYSMPIRVCRGKRKEFLAWTTLYDDYSINIFLDFDCIKDDIILLAVLGHEMAHALEMVLHGGQEEEEHGEYWKWYSERIGDFLAIPNTSQVNIQLPNSTDLLPFWHDNQMAWVYDLGFPCHIVDNGDGGAKIPKRRVLAKLSESEKVQALRNTIKKQLAKTQVTLQCLFHLIDPYVLDFSLAKYPIIVTDCKDVNDMSSVIGEVDGSFIIHINLRRIKDHVRILAALGHNMAHALNIIEHDSKDHDEIWHACSKLIAAYLGISKVASIEIDSFPHFNDIMEKWYMEK